MGKYLQALSCIVLFSAVFVSCDIPSIPLQSKLEVVTAGPTPQDYYECGKLAMELESCWFLGADLPKCSGQSRLLKCSTTVLKNITACKIPLIVRFLVGANQGYTNSDKILCQNNLYKAFLADPDCWFWAREAAKRVIYITKGFLTADACSVVSLTMDAYKTALGSSCGPLLGKYVDPLYKASPCGSGEAIVPKPEEPVQKAKEFARYIPQMNNRV